MHRIQISALSSRLLALSLLAFSISEAATPLPDARLTGNATVPSGATLTIASGGALTVASGATVNGLATSADLTNLNEDISNAFGQISGLQADLTTGLSGKLDKVTGGTTPRAYIISPAGTQETRDLTATVATAGQIVTVGSGGHVWLANAPSNDAHATRKSYVDGRTPQPTHAVFTLPLTGAYTDFEIKISNGNFLTGALPYMYLYYHSPDPARSSVTQYGPKPDVYFTDSGWSGDSTGRDHRSYRKQSATQSIWAMRSDSNAVIPTVKVVIPVDATIRPGNADLVWVYCRITGTDYERDGAGRVIWHQADDPAWVTQAPSYLP